MTNNNDKNSDIIKCTPNKRVIHMLWVFLLLSLIANLVLLWKVFWVPTPGNVTPAPCSSDPCQNGATCTLDVQDYICQCADGFTGTNCEIDLSKHQTCTSCSSEIDPTCTENTTPSNIILCDGGTCYLTKDKDTNAISRGCYSADTMMDNRLLHPQTGQFICSSFPPGVAGVYTCVCDGKNCNNATNNYTVMGGPDLEKGTPYENSFNCKCPSLSCSTLCNMDKTYTVKGCQCSPCGSCN
ncbi:hypothetical protein LSH36_1205g00104 [Paralvinella palmiformis]|uniref:EGF-like domain-containing protein n=1 Tax=Paralvinella palmiformis TaxID=53620 RepID=A0AAD9MS12_9ANNE|nr:hypothetical protein LSH36_1205g00104 [Paralvinella palmiformis]